MISETTSRGLGGLGLFVLGVGVAASCALDRSGGLFVGTDTGTGGSTSSSTGTGAGGSTSSSAGTGGAGAGVAEECNSPADCQGTDSSCAQKTCIGFLCGWDHAVADTPCSDNGGSVCDGNGICVECNSPAQCQPGSCTNGVETAAETCTDHTCQPDGTPISCDPYVCSGDQCLGSCGSTNDCASGNWCDSTACVPTNPNGTPCGSAEECTSTHCTDGVCCNISCTAQCRACVAAKTDGADGTCAAIPLWDDPDSECGPLGCDGAMTCATCGYEPTPTGTTCPSFCSNNCAGNTCVIDCPAKDSCKAQTITCPQGLACELDCSGDNSCEDAIVHCPDDYACTATCSSGHHSCDNMTFNCSTYGTCTMDCLGGDTCKNADINCGSNACTATCAGGDYPALHSTGGSCSATSC